MSNGLFIHLWISCHLSLDAFLTEEIWIVQNSSILGCDSKAEVPSIVFCCSLNYRLRFSFVKEHNWGDVLIFCFSLSLLWALVYVLHSKPANMKIAETRTFNSCEPEIKTYGRKRRLKHFAKRTELLKRKLTRQHGLLTIVKLIPTQAHDCVLQ